MKLSKPSKLLKGAAGLGTALSALNIANDIHNDGQVKVSNAVDGGLIVLAGVAAFISAPIALGVGTGILIYGIVDYTFDIGGKIDSVTNQIEVYDK